MQYQFQLATSMQHYQTTVARDRQGSIGQVGDDEVPKKESPNKEDKAPTI